MYKLHIFWCGGQRERERGGAVRILLHVAGLGQKNGILACVTSFWPCVTCFSCVFWCFRRFVHIMGFDVKRGFGKKTGTLWRIYTCDCAYTILSGTVSFWSNYNLLEHLPFNNLIPWTSNYMKFQIFTYVDQIFSVKATFHFVLHYTNRNNLHMVTFRPVGTFTFWKHKYTIQQILSTQKFPHKNNHTFIRKIYYSDLFSFLNFTVWNNLLNTSWG